MEQLQSDLKLLNALKIEELTVSTVIGFGMTFYDFSEHYRLSIGDNFVEIARYGSGQILGHVDIDNIRRIRFDGHKVALSVGDIDQ